MFILPSWKPFFEGPVRMHGRAAQLAGGVDRLEPAEEQLLHTTVQADDDTHTVTIGKDGRFAEPECTCDAFAEGAYCLHIWASLLDLDANEEGPGCTLNDLTKLRLRAPKARKRDDSARPVRVAEPQWMGRLSLLRPSADEDQSVDAESIFPTQRQVLYVIMPELCARHNGLIVDLQQRTAIASGWSKPKPLRVGIDMIDSLADPVDRELVAMMLGATWVTSHESGQAFRLDRTHATYRVAPGAQRSLLQDMIGTGRCYVELDENESNNNTNQRPLRWAGDEKPWKLWLIGHQTADGLIIDLQLRRAGKRLPVTDPEVVLGGRDGLVLHANPFEASRQRYPFALAAAFDDRDAIRWVNQFRDTRYSDEEVDGLQDAVEDVTISPSALRVSAEELPRFLERLYLLPQLPELDFPDGLGKSEQLIDPVPHLDVYSPGSTPATELVSGVGKSSLVGRVWFDYAGERINPAQRGRFVPLSAPKATAASTEAPVAADGEPVVVGETSDAQATEVEAQAQATDEVAVAVEEVPTEAEPVETAEVSDEPHPDQRLIRRDLRAERDALAATAGLGLRHTASATGDVVLVSPKQMPRAVAELIGRGWVVSADEAVIRAAGPPALSITSGIDWFELRGNVTYTQADGTEEEFTLPQILAAARSGKHMLTLGDGSQALLPEQWLEDHGLLTALGKIEGDHLRFKASQAAMLDALLDDRELQHIDDRFAEARKRIKMFAGVEPLDPADQFGGKLRTYQREGLGWLNFLRHFGMGGILADDMGLGKTVQVLAMVQARKLGLDGFADPPALAPPSSNGSGKKSTPAKSKKAPSLIVVPRSVIFNWLDEAKKFTPELRVTAYSGPDRASQLATLDKYDLVVTSYGLMRRDIDQLREQDFDYIVLDEAQAIKNPASQSAKSARLLRAEHRLALTGTPVENHLGDLWSIFEFLNPGMLGANARFSELVRGASSSASTEKLGTPVEPIDGVAPQLNEMADGDEGLSEEEQDSARADTITQVATALRPFILRRTKTQVLDDLPLKTEQTILCEMEPAQRKVYDELRAYYRGSLMQQLDAPGAESNGKSKAADSGSGVGRNAFMVLEALLRLRQAACHPALINKEGLLTKTNPKDVPSAKLDTLIDMLAEVIDGGQKALVFSQFTSMLSLVRKRLDELGIRYAYLDGQTRNRKEVVEQFQEDPDLQVFLISLKAGGVGLNLTAAEYVFILDPWWNPAVEAQAIDRTHRIGQTKPVFAYRMICEDTVEQRIIELQDRKRKLADAIVGGEQNLLQSLTRADIEQLLS